MWCIPASILHVQRSVPYGQRILVEYDPNVEQENNEEDANTKMQQVRPEIRWISLCICEDSWTIIIRPGIRRRKRNENIQFSSIGSKITYRCWSDLTASSWTQWQKRRRRITLKTRMDCRRCWGRGDAIFPCSLWSRVLLLHRLGIRKQCSGDSEITCMPLVFDGLLD